MKLIGFIIALIYTLIPTDLLPDMIPVLGWLDDIALWALFVWYFYLHLRGEEDPIAQDAGRQEDDQWFHRHTADDGGRQTHREKADPHSKTHDRKDPYTVLGVERGAPPEVIKKAYRALAGTYHPDKFAHLGEDFQKTAEERFKEIQEAYQTLMKN